MEEEKEVIEVDTSSDVIDTPTFSQKVKKGAKKHRLILFLSQFSFTLSLILFITLSCTVKGPFGPYNLNGWGLWWIFFLIMPVLPQLLLAIRLRKIQLIPVDWLSVISFLLVGLLTGMWHPYWALLFVGPIFHLVIVPFI
ncbi:MAG: hypothetical protein MJ208_01440 [Bacilli bacterium]|nr:hypothetical protein [Bacilli bacterium]